MIKIEIDWDNSAFENNEIGETVRLLSDLIYRMENEWPAQEREVDEKLRDINGNIVGSVYAFFPKCEII